MDIKDILSVGLTADDFDVCIEGIDAIPEKRKAEEGMRSMVSLLLGSMGSEARKKEMQTAMERKMKEMEKECAAQKEDLVILKSKLILLKRLLISNEAVKMTNEILNPPPPPRT